MDDKKKTNKKDVRKVAEVEIPKSKLFGLDKEYDERFMRIVQAVVDTSPGEADSDTGSECSDVLMVQHTVDEHLSTEELLRDIGGRKRVRSRTGSGSDTTEPDLSDEEAPASKVVVKARRGRGRPPTTGQYVGLAKAKAKLLAVEREELKLQAEKELSAMTRTVAAKAKNVPACPGPSKQGEDNPSAEVLAERIKGSCEVVDWVAKKSGNLKGTFTKALKEAVETIMESSVGLRSLSATDETARLEAVISHLREERSRLQDDQRKMREELDAMKVEMECIRRQGQEAGTPPEPEMMRLFRTEMASLTARFAVIEGKILRPPLAGDRTVAEQAPAATYAAKAAPPKGTPAKAASPKGAPAKAAPPTMATAEAPAERQPSPTPTAATSKSQSKGKGKGKKSQKAASNPVVASAQSGQSADKPSQGEWQTATNKKKERKRAAKKRSQQKKAAAKLRVPSSAAVVISLQPGAQEKGISYLSVLTEAKSTINLEELGIPSLKFKVAVTGARILEVPGAASKEQADALASKLRECTNGEYVRISRPVKCAELRVTGLDETVTSADVSAVAARVGGCSVDDIKVGDIRMGPSGLGSVWLRCPVAAAKAIAGAGRLLVGWVSAGVALLEPRPLQCYRCLYGGHTQHTCLSEEDRSELCYRCSQKGHRANQCPNELHCSLCAAVGKPAAHRIGAKSCEARAMKKKKGGKSQSRAAPQPMDTTQPDTEPASSAQQCSGTATGGRLGEV